MILRTGGCRRPGDRERGKFMGDMKLVGCRKTGCQEEVAMEADDLLRPPPKETNPKQKTLN